MDMYIHMNICNMYLYMHTYIDVIGWLSHIKFYIAPQIIMTCKMPSDTPNSITGHVDLLLSGEMSTHEI